MRCAPCPRRGLAPASCVVETRRPNQDEIILHAHEVRDTRRVRAACVTFLLACVAAPFAQAWDGGAAPEAVLEYSTFLGGVGADSGHAIATDGRGGVYVAGQTTSTSFPDTFVDTFERSSSSSSRLLMKPATDVFVAKFDLSPGKPPVLVWSKTFGGRADDQATSIAVDDTGAVYVAGMTSSDDFPVTSQA